MKKLLSVMILLAMMMTMFSCTAAKSANPIDYGKKYILTENQYYVFEKDQTGYYECHYKYENAGYAEYNYTLSGRIEFVWREASNGAVYLFETKTTYHEDHTNGKELSLINDPIYFAEEFFTYSYCNSNGSVTRKYIKEGSSLEKSLEK